MWILFLFLFISIVQIVHADQKVYFDPQTNKEIVDISGVKSKENVIEEFGLSNSVKEVIIKSGEGYRVKNNEIEKYDIKKEADDAKAARDSSISTKRDSIKQKLNLSDQEFENLKEVLNP